MRAAAEVGAGPAGLPIWLQVILWAMATILPLILVERRFRREAKSKEELDRRNASNLDYDQLQEDAERLRKDVESVRLELREQRRENEAVRRQAVGDVEYYQACLRVVEEELTELRRKIAETGLIVLDPRRPFPPRSSS